MLRKGWPAELGGIYTREEMEQSETGKSTDPAAPTGSVHEDLAAAREGAKNAGHGKKDSQKKAPANPAQQSTKDKEDPKTHMCVNCRPSHPRAAHDGEAGYGAA